MVGWFIQQWSLWHPCWIESSPFAGMGTSQENRKVGICLCITHLTAQLASLQNEWGSRRNFSLRYGRETPKGESSHNQVKTENSIHICKALFWDGIQISVHTIHKRTPHKFEYQKVAQAAISVEFFKGFLYLACRSFTWSKTSMLTYRWHYTKFNRGTFCGWNQ